MSGMTQRSLDLYREDLIKQEQRLKRREERLEKRLDEREQQLTAREAALASGRHSLSAAHESLERAHARHEELEDVVAAAGEQRKQLEADLKKATLTAQETRAELMEILADVARPRLPHGKSDHHRQTWLQRWDALEGLAEQLVRSNATWDRRGDDRLTQLAVIGLLVTEGLPYTRRALQAARSLDELARPGIGAYGNRTYRRDVENSDTPEVSQPNSTDNSVGAGPSTQQDRRPTDVPTRPRFKRPPPDTDWRTRGK